jgi:hypothetical protein
MDLFKRLARQYANPLRVQALLRSLPYNREDSGETLRSAQSAWRARKAHCLEAALLAAAILEHKGFPPLVMSLESDDLLDHVIYVYRLRGRWGSIARSRDESLHGRRPVFRSLRDLAWSYVDAYVDGKGRMKAYGVCSLDDAGCDWRQSPRSVWKLERHLIDLPHQPLRASDERHERVLRRFRREGAHQFDASWL